MSDIVERLRDLNVHVVCQAALEAADTITALRLRNAELRTHRDSLNSDLARGHQEAEAFWRKALAEVIALRLRVERLEGALEETVAWIENFSELTPDIKGIRTLAKAVALHKRARAVLAEGKTKPEKDGE